MLRLIPCLLALVPARAQEALPQSPAEALKPLDFMIGTWTRDGESPRFGKYVEEHVVDWMQDRTFIRAEYTMKAGDKIVWSATSIIGYDAQKKRLVSFGFGKNGAIARGEETPSGKKDVWVFENKVSGLGAVEEDRVTQTKIDGDTFSSTVEMKKDGQFQPPTAYTYRRKK